MGHGMFSFVNLLLETRIIIYMADVFSRFQSHNSLPADVTNANS